MKDLIELEVMHIATKNGKLVATLSYQDLTTPVDLEDVNNGYRTIEVPVNLRDLQLSPRGNQLVNQSKDNPWASVMPSDTTTGGGQLSPAFLKSIETIEKNLKRQ
jgi:hypothetical protein